MFLPENIQANTIWCWHDVHDANSENFSLTSCSVQVLLLQAGVLLLVAGAITFQYLFINKSYSLCELSEVR